MATLVAELRCRGVARLNTACVVCGTQNPTGLRIRFRSSSDGATARWTPTNGWESFEGIVHGGIITTVLDEAMSQAIIARGWEALTVELKVRFRGRVAPGDGLQVRGWVVDRRKRRVRTEAVLITDAGDERAHAWATFLVPPQENAV
jgi:acyl-coenzyme A thioesterase PaaI-like protein